MNRCTLCDKSFSSKRNVFLHVQEKHLVSVGNNQDISRNDNSEELTSNKADVNDAIDDDNLEEITRTSIAANEDDQDEITILDETVQSQEMNTNNTGWDNLVHAGSGKTNQNPLR